MAYGLLSLQRTGLSSAPEGAATLSGASSAIDSHANCIQYRVDCNKIFLMKEMMADPFAALREVVLRYEEALREREQELVQFRAQAAAYEKFLQDQIDNDLSMVDILKGDIKRREETVIPPPDLTIAKSATVVRAIRRRLPNQTDRIRAAARKILADHGGTLTRAELKAEMEKQGLVIESADFLELIRAALKRSPDFVHISGVGYKLSEGIDKRTRKTSSSES